MWKTEDERREIFKVAVDDLVAANPAGGGFAQRQRVDALFIDEFGAAIDSLRSEQQEYDRQQAKVSHAIDVFRCEGPATSLRDAAVAVLENYLKGEPTGA